ncbi:MAG: hypothetical protein IKS49_00910 [Actinomycetaceae bacterium]|nr:hypothetical protein [Actinomycetaceae bacterium]
MSIAVAEKLTWDERINALAPAHQKLLGDLVDEFTKIDSAQLTEPEKYSKEWYIAKIQKGFDEVDAGLAEDGDVVVERVMKARGLW